MRFLKSFLKTIIWGIGIILVLSMINRWYLGGFTDIKIQEQAIGPYTIAYVHHTGYYSNIGQSIDKVYMLLSGAGIVSYTGIGIYYDDPAVVSGENLRSDIGVIINDKDMMLFSKQSDISIKKIPEQQSIIIPFPLKNSVSYIVGAMKVYPILKKYMLEKGYKHEVPVIELYDIVAKTIYYIVEIQSKVTK